MWTAFSCSFSSTLSGLLLVSLAQLWRVGCAIVCMADCRLCCAACSTVSSRNTVLEQLKEFLLCFWQQGPTNQRHLVVTGVCACVCVCVCNCAGIPVFVLKGYFQVRVGQTTVLWCVCCAMAMNLWERAYEGTRSERPCVGGSWEAGWEVSSSAASQQLHQPQDASVFCSATGVPACSTDLTLCVVWCCAAQSRLALEWREWLTSKLLGQYFADRSFYQLQAGALVDNPGERQIVLPVEQAVTRMRRDTSPAVHAPHRRCTLHACHVLLADKGNAVMLDFVCRSAYCCRRQVGAHTASHSAHGSSQLSSCLLVAVMQCCHPTQFS